MNRLLTFTKIQLLLLLFFAGGQEAFSRPLISFFTELPSSELQALIARPGIKDLLLDMGAEIRIGVNDFTQERAESIKELNEAGIPVYAWLKAHDNQGHTFRIDNASFILKRYKSFKEWTSLYQLSWEGIGIDLRPHPEMMQNWVEQPILSAWNSYLNLFNQEELDLAFGLYQEFIKEAHADGFQIESYVLPFALDEAPTETKGLQYLGQIVNLKTDKTIPLCYTSFPYIQPAAILDYGGRSGSVGIGSTSSSLFEGKLETQSLDWESLSRDMRLAHDVCKEIHIANLESILANGWLESIAEFDFSVPVFLYSKEIDEHATNTYLSQKAFQALSYPLLTSIGFILLAILSIILSYSLIRYLFNWKKKNESARQEEIDYEIISS